MFEHLFPHFLALWTFLSSVFLALVHFFNWISRMGSKLYFLRPRISIFRFCSTLFGISLIHLFDDLGLWTHFLQHIFPEYVLNINVSPWGLAGLALHGADSWGVFLRLLLKSPACFIPHGLLHSIQCKENLLSHCVE